MDPLTISLAIAGVTLLGGGKMQRVKRKRRAYHATTVCNAAGQQYLEVLNLLPSVKLTSDTFISQLGARSAADYQRQANRVLDAAQTAVNNYSAYAMTADPAQKNSSQGHAEMIEQYSNHAAELSKQRAALQRWADVCQEYISIAASVPMLRASTATTLNNIDQSLNNLKGKGLHVATLCDDTAELRQLFDDIDTLIAEREMLMANSHLHDLDKRIAVIAATVRELPRQRKQILQQMSGFERQLVVLVHLLNQAEATLPVLAAKYDTNCLISFAETLDTARTQLNHIEELRQSIPSEVSCGYDTLENIASFTTPITEGIERIQAACHSILGANEKLEQEMMSSRQKVAALQRFIQTVQGKVSHRQGFQYVVTQALQDVSESLAQFEQNLDTPQPHPPALRNRLDQFNQLVEDIDEASCSIAGGANDQATIQVVKVQQRLRQ